MKLRKILNYFMGAGISARACFDSAEVTAAKAVVRDRGYSYCLYIQGFAHSDHELDKAAHILLKNGYLLAHENGDLIGTFGPLNGKFPRPKPRLVSPSE